MSGQRLAADLRALGFECRVDVRDGLAVLVPAGDSSLLSRAEIRREAVRLAESHGFTHLALELEPAR